MSGWTEERVAELRRLWAEGWSAGNIAKRLGGFEHTRDGGRRAVMGKANRLGLLGNRGKGFNRPRRAPWQELGRGAPRSLAPISHEDFGAGNVDPDFEEFG